jgi:hypothetical protein
MADREPLGEDDIKALVAREIALTEDSRAKASEKQTKALEYYQGTMTDVPAETGRSSVVSRDTADVIGWMLPGIIRVFTASDHMAVAEPVGAEDDQWADQATDGINYVFWKDNDGYRIVYNATWDSLIAGNGIVKTWWDDTPRTEVSFHTGLSAEALGALLLDPETGDLSEDIEILQHTLNGDLHDVKIRRNVGKGQTRVEAIPPEDFGINAEAKTCEEARFIYHRSDKTRSELIEMGFDRGKVEGLTKAKRDESEELARDERQDTDDGDSSMETVDYYECYIRADVDGDGIAEMCRVSYAGSELLDWEEWEDDLPFDDIPCNPMPHRWEAQSIADETMDVQRVKTVLLRQALDNTYATNNPQRFVQGKISNPEELFNPSFGGAIFGDAGSAITPLAVPFVANHAYDAINYQDQVIERRTGVSRTTMALDPEALQNQTATANQNARDAAYSQIELIARNQAELGWKKVFRKILKLEIKHQDQERVIRMRGKPVTIDPRHWNVDMDISINVGLGTGSRDRDMAMLNVIKADQIGLAERLAGVGLTDRALDMVPYVLTTMTKSAEAAGIKAPEMFFPDITEEEIAAVKQQMAQKQGQPDPKMQAQMQIEQMKAQGNQIKEAAQLQADLQAKQADREASTAMEQMKQQFEATKLQLDYEYKMAALAQQREIELLKLGMQDRVGEDGVAQPADKVDIAAGMLMEGLERLGALTAQMASVMNAPTEIVRDPVTQRAIGARKVLN